MARGRVARHRAGHARAVRRGDGRGGPAHDGGARAAVRQCPDRLVDGDPGPPRQRRPGDQRRAPAGRRDPGSDPFRHRRGPADAVRQVVPAVRPAAGVRKRARGDPGRGRPDGRQHQGQVHHPRRDAARGRRRRGAPGRDRRQPRPPTEPEPGRPARHEPHARGPARARRSLERDRSIGLAGRRRRPTQPGPARGAARLGRRRRPSGDRRGDDGSQGPVGVPGLAAAVSPGHDDRRRGRLVDRDPRRLAVGGDRAPSTVRHADRRACPGQRRGPGRGRRAHVRQRADHAARVRPHRRPGSSIPRRRRACGAASSRPDRPVA